MGTEITRTNDKINGKNGGNTNTESNRNTSAAALETERTRDTDRTVKRTERTTATDGGKTEKTKPAELAVLNEETPPEVKQGKPKRKPKKKTAPPQTDSLNTLILTGSTIIASRQGWEHWQLTPEEVQSISTPLMGVLNDCGLLEKVTENSNALALVTACAMVFTPRVIITVQKSKKKVKKVERRSTEVTGNQSGTEKKIERTVHENNGNTTNGNANNGEINPNDSTVYGLPIY